MEVDDRHLTESVVALYDGYPVLLREARRSGTRYHAIIAAGLAQPHWTSWLVRHGSGLLCVALPRQRAEALALPPMVPCQDPRQPRFAVAVDAAHGVTTGISAADRACTARILADPKANANDLTRPGHVLPVVVDPRGVLGSPQVAEAAADLCRLAGMAPVALFTTLVNDSGELAETVPDCPDWNGLSTVDLSAIALHRLRYGDGKHGRITRRAATRRETSSGAVDIIEYYDHLKGVAYVAVAACSRSERSPITIREADPVNDIVAVLGGEYGSSTTNSVADIARTRGVLIYLRESVSLNGNFPLDVVATQMATQAILADLGIPGRSSVRPRPVTAPAERASLNTYTASSLISPTLEYT